MQGSPTIPNSTLPANTVGYVACQTLSPVAELGEMVDNSKRSLPNSPWVLCSYWFQHFLRMEPSIMDVPINNQ